MSKPTAANFFIFSPSEAKSAELYQALLRGIENYQQLGRRLIRLAEQAHAFRQFDQLKEAALMLANIPVRSYQAIGHYFLAIATHRVANGNGDEAKRWLELAVDTAPDAYRAKAILSLGALSMRKKDFDSAIYYYRETIRAGKLSDASLIATRGIATVKSMAGDHAQAVKDLESILPVIKYAPPHIYFDLLNSYAVELGEVGRKDEARNITRVVLASPYARVYPEWRETAKDLRPSRHSFVAFDSPQYNVLTMPEREPRQPPALPPTPAQVFNFAKLKKKLVKKAKDRQTEQILDHMSIQDMGFKLLDLITKNSPTKHQMRIILTFVIQLFSKPDPPSA